MENLQSAIINKVKIHWIDKGQGEPLIFVPGALGDYRTWTHQLDFFAKHFRVIIMNRRFQFPSTYPKGGTSSVVDNCEDLLGLMQHLHLDKATLIGHSYGGYIAIAFAEKYPERVNKLILEEPAVFTLITNNPRNPFKLLPLALQDLDAALSFMRTGIKGIVPTQKLLAKGEYEKAKLTITDGIIGHNIKLDELNPLMRQSLEDNIATFEGDSRNAFDYNLTRNKLKTIQTKTLLLQGDKSPHWFIYICKELNKILPNAQLVNLNAPTHWLHLDRADEFNKEIIQFIQKG